MIPLELLSTLSSAEPDTIIRSMAMMSFNPAIGRVMESGTVDRFSELMVEFVQKLYDVQSSRADFDALHHSTCQRLMDELRTARNGHAPSFGQAQKPLNVFLKVFVDWAHRPTPELASKLSPMLHVPLDSVLMETVSRLFEKEYREQIESVRRRRIEQLSQRLGESPSLIASALGNEFSLTAMDKETYMEWQSMLRSLYPAKPVLLDVIWGLNRREGAANV